MLRSVTAIVAGFLFIGALSIGTTTLLQRVLPTAFDAAGRVESAPVLLLMLAYVGVFAVSGCYLAARLAPSHPMRHALVLGVLGLAFNVAGSLAAWQTAPAWYHVTAIALVLPYAWAGGRLRAWELRREPAAPPVSPAR